MTAHRVDDSDSTFSAPISRTIPLWGILSVLATGLGIVVGMFYGLQSTSATLIEVRADLKALTIIVTTKDRDIAVMQMRVDEIGRRIIDIERQIGDIKTRTGVR